MIWKTTNNNKANKQTNKNPKPAFDILKLIIVIYHPLCYKKWYGYSMKTQNLFFKHTFLFLHINVQFLTESYNVF